MGYQTGKLYHISSLSPTTSIITYFQGPSLKIGVSTISTEEIFVLALQFSKKLIGNLLSLCCSYFAALDHLPELAQDTVNRRSSVNLTDVRIANWLR